MGKRLGRGIQKVKQAARRVAGQTAVSNPEKFTEASSSFFWCGDSGNYIDHNVCVVRQTRHPGNCAGCVKHKEG